MTLSKLDALGSSTVWVANLDPKKSYDTASKYGECVFITRHYIDLRNMADIRSKFEKALEKAESTDYLILNGPSVINALMVAIMFRLYGFVNVLAWDPHEHCYTNYTIGLSGEFINKVKL